MIWYVGSINKVPQLDLLAVTDASLSTGRVATLLIFIVAGLLVTILVFMRTNIKR